MLPGAAAKGEASKARARVSSRAASSVSDLRNSGSESNVETGIAVDTGVDTGMEIRVGPSVKSGDCSRIQERSARGRTGEEAETREPVNLL